MNGPRDFSTRAAGRGEPPSTRVLFALAAAVLAWSAWAAGGAWADHRDARRALDEVRRERDEARARLAPAGRPGDATTGVLARAVMTLEAPPPRVIAALARVLPAGVRLDGLGIRYGEDVRLDLDVAARDPAAYDAFVQRLARDPAFRSVLPGDETRSDVVKATVRATFAERAP